MAEASSTVLTTALRICPQIAALRLIVCEDFFVLSKAIINIRPSLPKLVLRFYGDGPYDGDSEATANLLRALPRLEQLELSAITLYPHDIRDPIAFRLQRLVLGRIDLKEHLFPFLTSASTTTLISLDLSSCLPFDHSDGKVLDLSPFISLASFRLAVDVDDKQVVWNQLDGIPPPSASTGYPPPSATSSSTTG